MRYCMCRFFWAFPPYICFSNYNPTSFHKLIRRFTDAVKILKWIELVHFLLSQLNRPFDNTPACCEYYVMWKRIKTCSRNEENKPHVPCSSAPLCIDSPSVFALRGVKHISCRSCEHQPCQRNVLLAIQVGTTLKKKQPCDIRAYKTRKKHCCPRLLRLYFS